MKYVSAPTINNISDLEGLQPGQWIYLPYSNSHPSRFSHVSDSGVAHITHHNEKLKGSTSKRFILGRKSYKLKKEADNIQKEATKIKEQLNESVKSKDQ